MNILKPIISCLVWFIIGIQFACLFCAIQHSEPVSLWVVGGAPLLCTALTVIQLNIKAK